MIEVHQVLDERQLQRIEGVHRGFLYQHLFAVGCLLLAGQANITTVLVERDEDVELVGEGEQTYIQVKTRSASIAPSDIADVLDRFCVLRSEHRSGRRTSTARFIIVVNQPPGPLLAAQLREPKFPSDVQLVWPTEENTSAVSAIPPAWKDVSEALDWCADKAELLPFGTLSPDSLVWKLAGIIQHISAGGAGYTSHMIQTEQLPELFEQLLIQLQDFPSPPLVYRPQKDEPGLDFSAGVRIICGFSGAGKTAWASQAAVHSGLQCAYFDVANLPGPAIASALVRELGARFLTGEPNELRKVLLPGAAGIESLRILDSYVGRNGLRSVVVIDNAHRVPAADLRAIAETTACLKLVFLCQPSESVRELEASLSINREQLSGWDVDTIAAEVSAAGGRGSIEAFERVRRLTGGLPLFVHNAGRISVSEFGGDLRQLCDAIDGQTSFVETAQEIILSKTFDALEPSARDAIAVMSLSDVGLSASELNILLDATLRLSAVQVAAIIRNTRSTGLIQLFGNRQAKIHDAARILGQRRFTSLDQPVAQCAQETLKNILFLSLQKNRDTSRFSLFIKTLVKLGDVKTIIELSSQELFHEMGLTAEIFPSLELASVSETLAPVDRFWALDGLVFITLKRHDHSPIQQWLEAMKLLLDSNSFGADERNAYQIKRIYFEAEEGNSDEVMKLLDEMDAQFPDQLQHQLILRYTAALALWRLEKYRASEEIVRDVINDYFDRIGSTPLQVVGRNPTQILERLNKYDTLTDDLKHLADSLELCAVVSLDQGYETGLLRIHAMKFYQLSGAIDSFVRVGQDLVDEFVRRHDFQGAREVMETHLLPFVLEYRMMHRIVAVRSQYAVVLALDGNHSGAAAEMNRLEPYLNGLTQIQFQEVSDQRKQIDKIRRRPLIPMDRGPAVRASALELNAVANLIGLKTDRFKHYFEQIKFLEVTGQPVDITFFKMKPFISVKVVKAGGGEHLYRASPKRLAKCLQAIELSNGVSVSLADIWTINPMPYNGFIQEELDAVDLAEAEARVGPAGETLRTMIKHTYHCTTTEDEDFYLRRFIAS